MRAFAWSTALALALLLVVAPACVSSVECKPENCAGCCDEADQCHPGNEVSACGKGASACISCAPSVCNSDGTCFALSALLDGGAFDASIDFGDDDAGADAGQPDGGMADAGTPDAGTPDAGRPDAGTPDAGASDGGARLPGIRLANFSGAPLDFCVWNTGMPVPTQAAFHPAGVPSGAVSDFFPFRGLVVNYNLLLVPPGVGCVTDAGFVVTTQLGDSALYRTRWYTRTGSPFGGGMFESVTPNRAGETVFFAQMQSTNARVTFVPDSDGGVDAGPPISISPTAPTLLPPGVPGMLVGDVPFVGTPPPRPFVGQAGGVVRIFMTGTEILVCDNLAPPVGNLSDCRPSVRAP